MNLMALTCPYCNAPVSLPPPMQAGQRIVCARCGEAFALRPGQAGVTTTPATVPPADNSAIIETPPAPSSLAAAPGRPRRPLLTPEQKRRNRLAAGAILVGMVLMAGLGLTLALQTVGVRRANDAGLKKRATRSFFAQNQPEEAAASPAQLAALGYLPEGLNLLIGLNVGELQRDQAGRQLLNQPVQIGPSEIKPAEIAGWCGLPAGEVDHLVLALATEDPILPRGVLLVRTRKPYQVEQVRSALKAERVPAADRKNLFRFSWPRPSLQAVVWCIDDRTLALALVPSNLETMPAQPHSGLKHLPAELRGLLEERIDPGASVWVVGVFEERTRNLLRAVPLLERDGLGWLGSLRGLAGWAQVQEQVRTGVALHFPDEAAARKREESWQGREEGGQDLKIVRDGSWLTLQYRTRLEAVLRALGQH